MQNGPVYFIVSLDLCSDQVTNAASAAKTKDPSTSSGALNRAKHVHKDSSRN